MLATKLITLSVLTFTTFAQTTEMFKNVFPSVKGLMQASQEVDSWPKVTVPHEFEAVARVYLWDADSKQL